MTQHPYKPQQFKKLRIQRNYFLMQIHKYIHWKKTPESFSYTTEKAPPKCLRNVIKEENW